MKHEKIVPKEESSWLRKKTSTKAIKEVQIKKIDIAPYANQNGKTTKTTNKNFWKEQVARETPFAVYFLH